MASHPNLQKTSRRRSLAKKIEKEMRAKKLSLKDLLVDLKIERREYRKKL